MICKFSAIAHTPCHCIKETSPMPDNNFKTSCHHMSTCALTGASAFFDAIPGSFMLINGPLWCYFYAMK